MTPEQRAELFERERLSAAIPEDAVEAFDKETARLRAEYAQATPDRRDDYDYVQRPPHYTSGSKEVIDMMVDIWGREKVAAHCEMCAFKYRMRVGKKPDQPIQRDLEKAQWYENKAAELRVDKLPF